jgi:hypothetical protein
MLGGPTRVGLCSFGGKRRAPFITYKELREEKWETFVAKCESDNFAMNSQYMKWLQSQNKLNHHLCNTGYAEK